MSHDPILRELELEKRGIEADKEATRIKKTAFISEIKNGLGDDIKSNPNGVIIHQKPKKNGFITFLKKLFSSF
jgi:hypothetical protein